MALLDGMIATGRLCEFVDELITIHNEEYKDKTLWELWLHRVFDKSYPDFVEGLAGGDTQAPTDAEVRGIVVESKTMLSRFRTGE